MSGGIVSRRNNFIILAIVVLAVASLVVVWPQAPSNYLPGIIPWPSNPGLHVDLGGGLDGQGKLIDFHRQGFRLGLDLQGGTHLVLRGDVSKVPAHGDPNDAVESARHIIERRINAYGVAEPIVQRRGADRIIVELPGVRDIEEAKSLIGKTAQMDFREQKTIEGQQQWVIATATNSDGVETPLTGRNFKKAEVGFDQGSKPIILFEFDGEGGKLFGEITTRLKGKELGIFLDDTPISTPRVQEAITGGRGQITGSFTLDEVRNLVIQLNAGALPLPVIVEEERTVDATLGSDSIRRSVIAGEIGLLVVAMFMIVYYRALGVIATAALLVYALVVLAIFKLIPVTLTLAGIAGFILSIGMAVDANILIFERMKEELRAGKTVTAAIDAGFGRAWPSIRDSNVSTIITCIILYWFGSNFGASIVMGFALTLALGVVVSMFSAYVVSHSFLRAVIGGRRALSPRMLGMPSFRPRLEAAGMRG